MYHQRFKTLEQRFAEKYTVHPCGCWIWSAGAHRPQEHPKIWDGDKYRRASHVAWEMHTGESPPEGRHICHKCDEPRCVNPEHLFVGDHALNMRDKAVKERSHRPYGRLNGRARITQAIALRIRERYAKGGISQQALGRRYGVSQNAVSRIVRGLAWI